MPSASARVATVLGVRDVPVRQPAPGAQPQARQATGTELNDVHELSVLSGAASTQAAQVDGLYFFLLAVTAFFSLLIAALVVVFAVKFHAEARRRGRRGDSRIAGARAALDDHPVRHRDGDVRVGREGVLRHLPPAGRRDGDLRRRQAVDVEGAAHGRQREINELHVPVGRPVKLIMGSEDVIHSFYIPAFRVKADVIPGRYNDCGSRRRSRDATTCSAPSTAARSTRG